MVSLSQIDALTHAPPPPHPPLVSLFPARCARTVLPTIAGKQGGPSRGGACSHPQGGESTASPCAGQSQCTPFVRVSGRGGRCGVPVVLSLSLYHGDDNVIRWGVLAPSLDDTSPHSKYSRAFCYWSWYTFRQNQLRESVRRTQQHRQAPCARTEDGESVCAHRFVSGGALCGTLFAHPHDHHPAVLAQRNSHVLRARARSPVRSRHEILAGISLCVALWRRNVHIDALSLCW